MLEKRLMAVITVSIFCQATVPCWAIQNPDSICPQSERAAIMQNLGVDELAVDAKFEWSADDISVNVTQFNYFKMGKSGRVPITDPLLLQRIEISQLPTLGETETKQTLPSRLMEVIASSRWKRGQGEVQYRLSQDPCRAPTFLWPRMHDPEETELMRAAQAGDAESVRRLATPKEISRKDQLGNTALHRATAHPDTAEVVGLLIKAGADINQRNGSGQTPLLLASYVSQLETVSALLRAGAHADASDQQGNTVLTEASYGYMDAPAVVELLLRSGANPNSATVDGRTPLITAVKYKQPRIAGLLIKAGANVATTDSQGRTAIFYAQRLPESAEKAALLQLLEESTEHAKRRLPE